MREERHTAASAVTATLYKGSVAYPGASATATATAAGDEVNVRFPGLCAAGLLRSWCLADAGAVRSRRYRQQCGAAG